MTLTTSDPDCDYCSRAWIMPFLCLFRIRVMCLRDFLFLRLDYFFSWPLRSGEGEGGHSFGWASARPFLVRHIPIHLHAIHCIP